MRSPASVPEEPAFNPPKGVVVSEDRLRTYAGTYAFAPDARLRVDALGGTALSVTALDRTESFDFPPIDLTAQLGPASNTESSISIAANARG